MPPCVPRRCGFSLIDLMIVVVVLGILAAIVAPALRERVDEAGRTAAITTQAQVRKALDLHYQKHGRWPDDTAPLEFENAEPITLPRGFQLEYRPGTGRLDLVELGNPEAVADPPVLVIDD